MDFAHKWGPLMGLYRAAKLKPTLNAMYGDKGKVSQYPTGQVLTLLALDRDEASHIDWVQHHYAKMAEAKARARGA